MTQHTRNVHIIEPFRLSALFSVWTCQQLNGQTIQSLKENRVYYFAVVMVE